MCSKLELQVTQAAADLIVTVTVATGSSVSEYHLTVTFHFWLVIDREFD